MALNDIIQKVVCAGDEQSLEEAVAVAASAPASVEGALRSSLLWVLSVVPPDDAANSPRWDYVSNLFTLSFKLSRTGLVEPALLSTLMDDLFDSQPLTRCRAALAVLEKFAPALLDVAAAGSKGKLVLGPLMHLLRRSRGCDDVLSGRVLALASHLYPDPSLGLSPQPPQPPLLEQSEDVPQDVQMGDATGEEGPSTLYESVRRLQEMLRAPSIDQWDAASPLVDAVLGAVRAQLSTKPPPSVDPCASSSSSSSGAPDAAAAEFYPQLLVSPRLFSLQMRDHTFLRQLLVQLSMYLGTVARAARADVAPRINDYAKQVSDALMSTKPDGDQFAYNVMSVIQDEEVWTNMQAALKHEAKKEKQAQRNAPASEQPKEEPQVRALRRVARSTLDQLVSQTTSDVASVRQPVTPPELDEFTRARPTDDLPTSERYLMHSWKLMRLASLQRLHSMSDILGSGSVNSLVGAPPPSSLRHARLSRACDADVVFCAGATECVRVRATATTVEHDKKRPRQETETQPQRAQTQPPVLQAAKRPRVEEQQHHKTGTAAPASNAPAPHAAVPHPAAPHAATAHSSAPHAPAAHAPTPKAPAAHAQAAHGPTAQKTAEHTAAGQAHAAAPPKLVQPAAAAAQPRPATAPAHAKAGAAAPAPTGTQTAAAAKHGSGDAHANDCSKTSDRSGGSVGEPAEACDVIGRGSREDSAGLDGVAGGEDHRPGAPCHHEHVDGGWVVVVVVDVKQACRSPCEDVDGDRHWAAAIVELWWVSVADAASVAVIVVVVVFDLSEQALDHLGLSIFQASVAKVATLNEGARSAHFEVSQWAHLSLDELRRDVFVAGWDATALPAAQPATRHRAPESATGSLPDTWMASHLGDVKFNCGWAAAVASLLEATQHHQTGKSDALQIHDLLQCASGAACQNHTLSSALAVLGGARAPSGAKGSVGAANGMCGDLKDNSPLRFFSDRFSEDALERSLLRYGPVLVEIDADDLPPFTAGVLEGRSECSGTTNHVALLVGWGSDQSGTFWVLQNSWGSSWGNGGLFRLRRGAGSCDLSRRAVLGVSWRQHDRVACVAFVIRSRTAKLHNV
eukprot:m51a1_g5980 putative cysteine proteinase ep-b 1-like (1080) ;mRNA; r:245959-250454